MTSVSFFNKIGYEFFSMTTDDTVPLFVAVDKEQKDCSKKQRLVGRVRGLDKMAGRGSGKLRKGGKSGSGNGFQALGLSDPVYRGIVRMGFRVSFCIALFLVCLVVFCILYLIVFLLLHADAYTGTKKISTSHSYWRRYLRHGQDRLRKNGSLYYSNLGKTRLWRIFPPKGLSSRHFISHTRIITTDTAGNAKTVTLYVF